MPRNIIFEGRRVQMDDGEVEIKDMIKTSLRDRFWERACIRSCGYAATGAVVGCFSWWGEVSGCRRWGYGVNQECGRRGVEGIVGVEGELGSMWRERWGGVGRGCYEGMSWVSIYRDCEVVIDISCRE